VSGLGKCRICGGEATALYPLMVGQPAFCSTHHNSRDAGRFGCDFTGPDDFDIPVEGEWGPWCSPSTLTRKGFVWTDREGNKHKLQDIDDRYLGNLINFLKRKDDDMFGAIIGFLAKEAERRSKEATS
jgi:hypothetical protein